MFGAQFSIIIIGAPFRVVNENLNEFLEQLFRIRLDINNKTLGIHMQNGNIEWDALRSPKDSPKQLWNRTTVDLSTKE